MTPFLIQFAADHPFLTFGLSWPLMLTLVVWAYMVGLCAEHIMNTLIRMGNILAVILRGYPPQLPAPVAAPESDDQG